MLVVLALIALLCVPCRAVVLGAVYALAPFVACIIAVVLALII